MGDDLDCNIYLYDLETGGPQLLFGDGNTNCIAADLTNPDRIGGMAVVGSDTVYFSEPALYQIRRFDYSAPTPNLELVHQFADATAEPRGLVASGRNQKVYGVDFDSGKVFSIAGLQVTTVFPASGLRPLNITTDGEHLFISERWSNLVWQMRLLESATTESYASINQITFSKPRGLTAMGDAVYIADGDKIVDLK